MCDGPSLSLDDRSSHVSHAVTSSSSECCNDSVVVVLGAVGNDLWPRDAAFRNYPGCC